MKLSGYLCAAVLATAGQAAKEKPLYKDPKASIDDRVEDLLKRMTIQEKTAQLIQGDMTNYLNITDETVNKTGMEWNFKYRANSIWTGLYANMTTIKKAAKLGQDYLAKETELGKSRRCLYLRIHNLMYFRYSCLCPERRSAWRFDPQWHHLQLPHRHGMFVQPRAYREDG
jgi:beta-glucosidase